MPETRRHGLPPSLDDIASLADEALGRLEEPFATHARAVVIKVEDMADAATLREVGIDNPYELTGLYEGVALTLETPSAPSALPPLIRLFRLPILDEWAASGDITLEELVGHVLIHELGHHFGWSDEEIDAINDAPA